MPDEANIVLAPGTDSLTLAFPLSPHGTLSEDEFDARVRVATPLFRLEQRTWIKARELEALSDGLKAISETRSRRFWWETSDGDVELEFRVVDRDVFLTAKLEAVRGEEWECGLRVFGLSIEMSAIEVAAVEADNVRSLLR